VSERILVFELEIPIRWGDMDAMGHVNNTVYFRYMEQTRISWFDARGIATDRSVDGPLIINARCTFTRELTYPGTVLARQYVVAAEIGRSSFETYVDMTRTDDAQVLYAQGAAKTVWVDYGKRKSTPLPDEVRRMLVTPF
jgi:acyl-CoA thioester hydrolase